MSDIKSKEKLLSQQSKMASMGQMLENIAHQWRQPLSLISTISTGLEVKKAVRFNYKRRRFKRVKKRLMKPLSIYLKQLKILETFLKVIKRN